MNDGSDPFDRALAAALRPPEQVRVRPDAGARLRCRVAHRRSRHAAVGIGGSLALVVVIVLAVGSVLHGEVLPPPGPTAAAMGMRAGELPALPWTDGPAPPAEFSYGRSRLANPLEVVRVKQVAAPQCTAAATKAIDSGFVAIRQPCHDLARPAILVVTHLAGAGVTRLTASGTVGVSLTLGEADSRALRAYTSEHVGSPIAFVVADRVWWAAEISHPVDDGVLEIVVGRSTADAVELVDSLGLHLVGGPGAPIAVPQ